MIHRDQIPYILFFIVCIAVSILLYTVDAAKVDYTTKVEGTGAISTNTGEMWYADSNGQYNGGSSGEHLMSGVGDFTYSRSDSYDATVNNRYTQDEKSTFKNGVIFDSELYMEDSSANVSAQSAYARYGGYLSETDITTAKFVNDANMSMGQQAAWNGVGLYTTDVGYEVALGTGDNETKINYVAESRKRQSVYTNETGGAIARVEFDYTDFADAYMANSSSETTSNSNTLGETQ